MKTAELPMKDVICGEGSSWTINIQTSKYKQSSYPLGFFQCMFTTLQKLDSTTEGFEVYIAK